MWWWIAGWAVSLIVVGLAGLCAGVWAVDSTREFSEVEKLHRAAAQHEIGIEKAARLGEGAL